MNEPTCDLCLFWEHLRNTAVVGKGVCRRYAPRAVVSELEAASMDAVWPETHDDEWCGDFVRKETASSERYPLPVVSE